MWYATRLLTRQAQLAYMCHHCMNIAYSIARVTLSTLHSPIVMVSVVFWLLFSVALDDSLVLKVLYSLHKGVDSHLLVTADDLTLFH